MDAYTTISGDTWDIIAKKAYGQEIMADRLMRDPRNYPILDYQVFPEGVSVFIPEIMEAETDAEDLPDWRVD